MNTTKSFTPSEETNKEKNVLTPEDIQRQDAPKGKLVAPDEDGVFSDETLQKNYALKGIEDTSEIQNDPSQEVLVSAEEKAQHDDRLYSSVELAMRDGQRETIKTDLVDSKSLYIPDSDGGFSDEDYKKKAQKEGLSIPEHPQKVQGETQKKAKEVLDSSSKDKYSGQEIENIRKAQQEEENQLRQMLKKQEAADKELANKYRNSLKNKTNEKHEKSFLDKASEKLKKENLETKGNTEKSGKEKSKEQRKKEREEKRKIRKESLKKYWAKTKKVLSAVGTSTVDFVKWGGTAAGISAVVLVPTAIAIPGGVAGLLSIAALNGAVVGAGGAIYEGGSRMKNRKKDKKEPSKYSQMWRKIRNKKQK